MARQRRPRIDLGIHRACHRQDEVGAGEVPYLGGNRVGRNDVSGEGAVSDIEGERYGGEISQGSTSDGDVLAYLVTISDGSGCPRR